MTRLCDLVELNRLKGSSFVPHKGLLYDRIASQQRRLRRAVEVVQVLKKSFL
jgi:hypothetical protein